MNKIKRRCSCGCGEVTNYGKRYVRGHNTRNMSEETKMEMSLSRMGNTNSLGYKHTKETKLKDSLAKLKYHPDDEYCEAWRDREYKKDLKKDYCENRDCKKISKKFVNHHINLNKKDCRPCNIMTMCRSCHRSLHNKLGLNANHKDYLTIIREDKITYIHKKTRRRVAWILKF